MGLELFTALLSGLALIAAAGGVVFGALVLLILAAINQAYS